ncbi:MarR family transcriptional regulator [Aestuariivita sp.]|jgi:DNA-binding MarR family transcriptional regulator|uniref:MarR family winged helix-turn-helix transcriptional regulator n=1 Tax=Aestuariivita sp. TaxID=1872407 RepID=UPI0021738E13|nr:MarR family transcriptional regulator [Aestuariivita sp.]MCE8005427.1 MarR family transcriptional regulator [Aestuariivita sp.]
MARKHNPADPPPTISDATLRGFSGYVMKRAFNAIQADVNASLAPLDLRMLTFSALSVIVDNPGLRQSQLADALSIERPNLVIVVDELERRDLILRNPAPGDRRAYALQATLKGMRLYTKALGAVQAHEARMTKGLSEDERQALIAMLSRIET